MQRPCVDIREVDRQAQEFWLQEIGPISHYDKYNTKLVYRKAEEFWAKEARLLLIQKLEQGVAKAAASRRSTSGES